MRTPPTSVSVDCGSQAARNSLPHPSRKDRSHFLAVLDYYKEMVGIDINATILVIGGTQEDVDVLRHCGFRWITLSNIDSIAETPESIGTSPVMGVDAEDSHLPDNAYDVVFVHEAIHHCRCPHRALCEMLRISKHYVVMMEPNDSACMRLLVRLRFSFPFEIAAVVDNDYEHGGVRNSQVPNFIYRWSRHEVYKAAASFLAEYRFDLYAQGYWDFNVDERDLKYRQQTRIGKITGVIGARNFIRLLHLAQKILNCTPMFRNQGNKFFCCIEKQVDLRPWLVREQTGQIVFNRKFQRPLNR
jgi:SAM-dependent methyltransferase